MILIFVLLFFAYYKKREKDGNPIDFGGNTDSGSSASGINDGPSSIPPASGGGSGGSGGGSSGGDGPNVDVPMVGNETNNQQPIADTTPKDCEGTWGNWTDCSAPCGQYGKQHRVYNITVPAKNGGACIEKQEKNCYGTPGVGACPAAPPLPPPQNCVLSGWYEMTPPGCTASCGPNGTVEWRRHVEVSQAYGGTCAGGLSKREACNRHTCPRNCVGGWQKDGDLYGRTGHGVGSCMRTYKQDWKCVITQTKLGTGASCNCSSDGDRKTTNVEKRERCGGNVGHWVSQDNETGIVADLLRNPYIEVSDDDLTYIVNKVTQTPLPNGRSRNEFEQNNIFEISQCKTLIENFEHKFDHKESDQKLHIDQKDLEKVIGKNSIEKIVTLADTRFEELEVTNSPETKWILRRSTEDTSKAIPFHRDWDEEGKKGEFVVVGVNLNTDYSGGIMMYLCNNKIERPVIKTGDAIIHDASTIHAVSPITEGIRYKLFYIISHPN